jgi:hypothetical protein
MESGAHASLISLRLMYVYLHVCEAWARNMPTCIIHAHTCTYTCTHIHIWSIDDGLYGIWFLSYSHSHSHSPYPLISHTHSHVCAKTYFRCRMKRTGVSAWIYAFKSSSKNIYTYMCTHTLVNWSFINPCRCTYKDITTTFSILYSFTHTCIIHTYIHTYIPFSTVYPRIASSQEGCRIPRA